MASGGGKVRYRGAPADRPSSWFGPADDPPEPKPEKCSGCDTLLTEDEQTYTCESCGLTFCDRCGVEGADGKLYCPDCDEEPKEEDEDE